LSEEEIDASKINKEINGQPDQKGSNKKGREEE